MDVKAVGFPTVKQQTSIPHFFKCSRPRNINGAAFSSAERNEIAYPRNSISAVAQPRYSDHEDTAAAVGVTSLHAVTPRRRVFLCFQEDGPWCCFGEAVPAGRGGSCGSPVCHGPFRHAKRSKIRRSFVQQGVRALVTGPAQGKAAPGEGNSSFTIAQSGSQPTIQQPSYVQGTLEDIYVLNRPAKRLSLTRDECGTRRCVWCCTRFKMDATGNKRCVEAMTLSNDGDQIFNDDHIHSACDDERHEATLDNMDSTESSSGAEDIKERRDLGVVAGCEEESKMVSNAIPATRVDVQVPRASSTVGQAYTLERLNIIAANVELQRGVDAEPLLAFQSDDM